MASNKQINQIDTSNINNNMLTKTIHHDIIFTFKMSDYIGYSKYREEGKLLLDQANLAIEALNKQAVNLYNETITSRKENEELINKLEKEEQQRRIDQEMIENLRKQIEEMKHEKEKTNQLNKETLNAMKETYEKDREEK